MLNGTVTEREGGQRSVPPRSNLPHHASSFVGRERELAEVRTLQASSRLLTLTGPGGSGKTRLALETAARLAEDFRDGIFWVDLSALSDPDLVPESVARVLGVRGATGVSPEEALLNHLEDKEILLALDNCEHLVEACAGLADALLRSCPGLRVLATSHEAFRIPGERAWFVPSLSLPDPQSRPNPEEAARFEAVRLFVQRVVAVVPDFALTEENSDAVVRICERLDGIPLAIELAAARVRVLSPDQIASRLDDRFLLLTGGSRVAVTRHRTLRAAMDWSHELLSGRERTLFRRLSAFTGGFSLEAAEAVCSTDDIDSGEILGLLFRLVDKSLVLVVRDEGRDGARYQMLETVLRYASERLVEAGEEDRVGDRHADFFLKMAEEAEPGLIGPEQGAWLERLDSDHANLRAAMRWYAGRGDPEAVLRMAGALWWFWFLRGLYGEGREWLEEGLATGGDTPAACRAKALTAAGDLAFLQSEYGRAKGRLEEGLALYRTLGDERGIASAVQLLGSIAREQGCYAQAEAFHGESLSLWRGLDDEWGVGQSLNYLGFVAWLRMDYERAEELCAQTLGIFRVLGDDEGVAWSLINLGAAALYKDERGQAAALLEESLALSRETGYREGAAWALNQLGILARREGHLEQAKALLRESLALHRDLGDRWRAASLLEELAGTAGALGGFERAGILFGAAEALREILSDPVPPCERADRERDAAAAQAALGEEPFAETRKKGETMTLERVYEYALRQENHAEPAPAAPLLSDRETEVLGLVAEGLTDPEVAGRLYLSPRTVGQHLRNVYRKLGVSSRAAATRTAMERGLI